MTAEGGEGKKKRKRRKKAKAAAAIPVPVVQPKGAILHCISTTLYDFMYIYISVYVLRSFFLSFFYFLNYKGRNLQIDYDSLQITCNQC